MFISSTASINCSPTSPFSVINYLNKTVQYNVDKNMEIHSIIYIIHITDPDVFIHNIQ